jgi:hypothetical protein
MQKHPKACQESSLANKLLNMFSSSPFAPFKMNLKECCARPGGEKKGKI